MIPLPDLRTGLELAGVLLLVVLGALLVRQRDERIRAEGRIGPMLEELDSVRVVHRRERAASDELVAQERARTAAADSVLELERTRRAAAERELERAIAEQPAAADSIVVIASTGDTLLVREAVQRLEQLHADERAGWVAVTRSDALRILELEAVAGARLDAMAGLERRALAAEERAAVAELALETALELRPGWFSRHGWKLAALGTAAAAWELRGRVEDD